MLSTLSFMTNKHNYNSGIAVFGNTIIINSTFTNNTGPVCVIVNYKRANPLSTRFLTTTNIYVREIDLLSEIGGNIFIYIYLHYWFIQNGGAVLARGPLQIESTVFEYNRALEVCKSLVHLLNVRPYLDTICYM